MLDAWNDVVALKQRLLCHARELYRLLPQRSDRHRPKASEAITARENPEERRKPMRPGPLPAAEPLRADTASRQACTAKRSAACAGVSGAAVRPSRMTDASWVCRGDHTRFGGGAHRRPAMALLGRPGSAMPRSAAWACSPRPSRTRFIVRTRLLGAPRPARRRSRTGRPGPDPAAS